MSSGPALPSLTIVSEFSVSAWSPLAAGRNAKSVTEASPGESVRPETGMSSYWARTEPSMTSGSPRVTGRSPFRLTALAKEKSECSSILISSVSPSITPSGTLDVMKKYDSDSGGRETLRPSILSLPELK